MHFEKDGLKQPPIILAVSKIRETGCIYKGNHRMAVLLNEDVPWLPRLVNRNWLAHPKPSNLGFKTPQTGQLR